jgi:ribosomal protein S18 acetylase RimI-like enzyme
MTLTEINPSFVITEAKKSDLQEIVTLVNSAYRGETGKMGWTTETDFLDGQRTDLDSLLPLIEKPGSTILMIRSQKKIVACGHAEIRTTVDSQSRPICYAGMLSVQPSMQNYGLGKHLLHAAVEFAKAHQCAEMEITVLSQRHELIAWYERHGFKKTGETRPFPYGDPRFGIPKIEGLHFLVLHKDVATQNQALGIHRFIWC